MLHEQYLIGASSIVQLLSCPAGDIAPAWASDHLGLTWPRNGAASWPVQSSAVEGKSKLGASRKNLFFSQFD